MTGNESMIVVSISLVISDDIDDDVRDVLLVIPDPFQQLGYGVRM